MIFSLVLIAQKGGGVVQRESEIVTVQSMWFKKEFVSKLCKAVVLIGLK